MAIAQTGAIYKSLSFDNTSSRSYGVYITGSAVYNAPERAVEMISIPGRNGAYALDQGRFENIEVSYPAGIFADAEEDFAQAISDFRNFLCSKKGYCRLTDEYNPDEYRMAVYKSGLEVDPVRMIAGEFTITFECKPQRFLTSGEAQVAVANNGTINNPTLFEASPVLYIQGYGDIGIGGQTVNVSNVQIGNVLLANSKTVDIDYPPSSTMPLVDVLTSTIDGNILNAGDTIALDTVTFTYTFTETNTRWSQSTNVNITNKTGSNVDTVGISQGANIASSITTFEPITLTKGTTSTTTHSFRGAYEFVTSLGTSSTITTNLTVQVSYDGDSTITLSATEERDHGSILASGSGYISEINGISTKTASGTKTIDLGIGEAVWDNSGTITNFNYAVKIPTKLPTLAPGSNTITYPNTITSFKIQPNWWKV